jgi:hypothetical protein
VAPSADALSYGSEALGCIGGLFIGFVVGLVAGALLSIKPVRLVRTMPRDMAMVLGTLLAVGGVVGVSALAQGW